MTRSVVRGEYHHGRFRRLPLDAPGCLETVDARKVDVHKHKVGAGSAHVRERFFLPGIDGLEAPRRIKGQAPKTAVVILTTHDTPRHRLAAAQAGAAGYIAKPDMETLF